MCRMRERYTDAALLFQHIWWMQLAVVCLAEAHMILLATTVLCSNCIQSGGMRLHYCTWLAGEVLSFLPHFLCNLQEH